MNNTLFESSEISKTPPSNPTKFCRTCKNRERWTRGGSTLVACVNTGRRGIGIELMQEYYDIAVKRVKDAQAQLKLD